MHGVKKLVDFSFRQPLGRLSRPDFRLGENLVRAVCAQAVEGHHEELTQRSRVGFVQQFQQKLFADLLCNSR